MALSAPWRLIVGLAALVLVAMSLFLWSGASIDSSVRCADGICAFDEKQPLLSARHREIALAGFDHATHEDEAFDKKQMARLVLRGKAEEVKVGHASEAEVFRQIDAFDAYLRSPTGAYEFRTSVSSANAILGALVFGAIALLLLAVALTGRQPFKFAESGSEKIS
jgi:hypothetical protein